MEKEQNILLITGDFEPAGAADILLSLINDKIRYHVVRSLKLTRGSKDLLRSEERIAALKEAKNRVTDSVLEAQRIGGELEIEGKLRIRIKKND